jgi:hypothetical protein
MSLEERHWPSLCIIALLLALSVVAVVEVCADATPVINAVLSSAIAIYLDFMVSSNVNRNNTGCSAWFHCLERAFFDQMALLASTWHKRSGYCPNCRVRMSWVQSATGQSEVTYLCPKGDAEAIRWIEKELCG